MAVSTTKAEPSRSELMGARYGNYTPMTVVSLHEVRRRQGRELFVVGADQLAGAGDESERGSDPSFRHLRVVR
ncbi:Uncharacterised protein [Mycobacteroides abscessus subsp. massiliense]|uniref:hypothetical protein n=1 Tax=Mycobacteroides abscessus TaxID=36809 RepID=UPI0009C99769|nr:hypothetical protein [Mycobacteroides abscessus]SKT56904.1 Uncharacterised protein [Mycobacteroides abscessus subsp. massiliense]